MQINLNPTSERGASRDAVNRPRETLGDSHLISSDPRSRFGLVCDLLCCRGNIEHLTQAIGRLAWSEGYEAILVPSPTRLLSSNIVVFPDKLGPGQILPINADKLEIVASFLEFFRPRTGLMQGLRGLCAIGRLLIPLHVQGDTLANVFSRPH